MTTSGDAPDRAAAGSIEMDRDGLVVAADGAASLILGTDVRSGLLFFEDVAPAAGVPAFRGRFLEGVRRGDLAERFDFVLGREGGALALSISMGPGSSAGLYRIGLEIAHRFEPTRQREAMLAVDQRARALPVDGSVCESEPIHIPGSIQSQGVLLVADLQTWQVEVASENCADVFGLGPADILGRALRDLIPADLAAEIEDALGRPGGIEGLPRRTVPLGDLSRPVSVAVHVHDGRLLAEFEAAPVRGEDFGEPTHGVIRAITTRFRTASDLDDLAEAAAAAIRRITGFDRVLIYRFDTEWNGQAIGEAADSDWGERLKGLRFPASDIPRQARDLYLRSPSRFVIDRDAAAIPLRAIAPADNRPVDLSRALFRSLSPVHLEYQRNLGVNGSMSIAILIEGRLWGLIIGHHRRPHYVAPETRDALRVLADTLALRIKEIEAKARYETEQDHLARQVRLLEQMVRGETVAQALSDGPVRLTDLFGATGAALVAGEAVTAIGQAPREAALRELVGWLRARPDRDVVFCTDHLAGTVPAAGAYAGEASGLLAASVDGARDVMLLWFRPEVPSTVVWGGDPRKSVLADPTTSAVLPRRSFERWAEERRGYSEPWPDWQIELARNFAEATGGVVLAQRRQIQSLNATQSELVAALRETERLLAEKDLLTREIDHRVKNSLQIVSAFLSMQSRAVADPDAKQALSDTYGRVMSIARVHDSLYQSEQVNEVDLGQTIQALCTDLAGVAGEQRDLELHAERGVMVPYRQAVALSLIATELVTNAWKYAYPAGERGSVSVTIERDPDGLRMRVCDQGEGLPADWQTTPRKGLGMQLIRAMLSQIDARMEVESVGGACFTVVC